MTTRLTETSQWIAVLRGGPKDGELYALLEPTPTLRIVQHDPPAATWLDDPNTEPELVSYMIGLYRLADVRPHWNSFPAQALYVWHGWE